MNRVLAGSAVLHGLAAAGLLAAPFLWPWWLGAVVANHAAIVGLVLSPSSQALGSALNRVPAAAAVVLTFDDGPDPEVTPHVLALLAAAEATASFFCIGERARQYPGLVRAIAAAGHGVENHTQHHPNGFAFLRPAGLRREVMAAQSVLAGLALAPPRFFRAPMGFRPPTLAGVLRGTGLHAVAWTRRGYDTVDRNPSRVLRRLLRDLSAGDVLLLHDGNAARAADGTPVVLAVLPPLLAALRSRGLSAVALPRSCAGTGPEGAPASP